MGSPIAAPASFGRFGTLRRFFAIADRREVRRRQAQLIQRGDGAGGAAVAQAQVVLGGTALVAMAFHGNLERGKFAEDDAQQLGIAAYRSGGFGREIEMVVGEEDVFQLSVYNADSFRFCGIRRLDRRRAGLDGL